MNLRNLSQEELIKMINEKDKKIEALTEQLNWYSQQIKLQQKKLFGSSSEKTVLPDQISLFDEIELESTPIKQEPELEEIKFGEWCLSLWRLCDCKQVKICFKQLKF